MGKLIFRKEQIIELVEFCNNNDLDTFYLAKDQGAFIGASGNHDNSLANCIQYAEGCNPEQDQNEHGDWYENSRNLCGGEDFVERFSLSMLEPLLDKTWTFFIISVEPTQLTFSVSC